MFASIGSHFRPGMQTVLDKKLAGLFGKRTPMSRDSWVHWCSVLNKFIQTGHSTRGTPQSSDFRLSLFQGLVHTHKHSHHYLTLTANLGALQPRKNTALVIKPASITFPRFPSLCLALTFIPTMAHSRSFIATLEKKDSSTMHAQTRPSMNKIDYEI